MNRPRVLVVDDDEGIRVTIEASLESCNVTTAASALEAQSILRERDFEVIVCDLVMPSMTGPELYESLSPDSPLRERFIFITGGNLPIALESFVSLASLPILRKPFTISAIREAVAKVIARG